MVSRIRVEAEDPSCPFNGWEGLETKFKALLEQQGMAIVNESALADDFEFVIPSATWYIGPKEELESFVKKVKEEKRRKREEYWRRVEEEARRWAEEERRKVQRAIEILRELYGKIPPPEAGPRRGYFAWLKTVIASPENKLANEAVTILLSYTEGKLREFGVERSWVEDYPRYWIWVTYGGRGRYVVRIYYGRSRLVATATTLAPHPTLDDVPHLHLSLA